MEDERNTGMLKMKMISCTMPRRGSNVVWADFLYACAIIRFSKLTRDGALKFRNPERGHLLFAVNDAYLPAFKGQED